ncbi:MAG: hypothetical protein GTN84_08505 [Hydrogenophaga sp.]|uniref:hypothetical protein n=1 Tax=Hydrogenophaga sp. TaxID=1904254 RepID=UPI0016BBDC96|nr:hypothetical protein [Hydrogenophaga sp.]NIM41132.1 hypothetical protein [Hydrogenophaga sp.]NIN26448.1 hypothetical protein [Hydrogenophaga sp.]NIN31323.1 hypothetical protein [Hydrogenophaga sp.]NIN55378.1 hypothetical protein [Hydrogenophaga sp.]NIO51713.1 hypothetical protein [Hydrogenophaga sp.]
MKQSIGGIFQRGRRAVARLLSPSRGEGLAPEADAKDWAHASAAGEEDPGASVDLLDDRPPPRAVRREAD